MSNQEWHMHTMECMSQLIVQGKCDCTAGRFTEKMSVRKVTGDYRYPGVVNCIFRTQAGKVRLVVESTSPDTLGMLHIFAPEQLEPA